MGCSFFKKNSYSIFDRKRWNWKVLDKIFLASTWNYIACVRKIFWWDYIFLEKFFLQIFIGTWTEKCGPFLEGFRNGRQNCTLNLQKTILKRVYKLQTFILFKFCGSWAKKFQPSRKFLRREEKLHSTPSEEHFEDLCVFEEKSLLVAFSDIRLKTLDIMGNLLLQGCWN